MVTSPINDRMHWRERAEEARVHAEQITDPESKQAMLRIAEDYEKLAKRAEERLRNSEEGIQKKALRISGRLSPSRFASPCALIHAAELRRRCMTRDRLRELILLLCIGSAR